MEVFYCEGCGTAVVSPLPPNPSQLCGGCITIMQTTQTPEDLMHVRLTIGCAITRAEVAPIRAEYAAWLWTRRQWWRRAMSQIKALIHG